MLCSPGQCAFGLVMALGLGFVAPRHAVGKPSALSHATVDARVQSANFTRGTARARSCRASCISTQRRADFLSHPVMTGSTAMYGVAVLATAAAGLLARAKRSRIAARAQPSHGRKFEYSMQKDSHADYEFINEVGCLDCVEIDEQLRSMSSFREFSKHRFSKR